jgi:inhibitor of cysteine peptidase
MKRTVAIALGVLIIAVVVGVTGASAGGAEAMAADASDSGSRVEMAVGDTLTVTLESNPTTGFVWTLADPEGMLEVVSNEYVMDPTGFDPPPPGLGGVEVWTFKALRTGETTISMEYSRPWDGGEETVETFDFRVVIN